jgi:tetratricopeptide (TPR) repeat protein
MRSLIFLIVVALFFVACASDPSKKLAPAGNVLATATEVYEVEAGPGAENCAELDAVHKDLAEGRLLDAQSTLNFMLSRFSHFEEPGKRVLSFGSESEYRTYLNNANDSVPIVPVDWCYRELFQLKAFVRSAQEDFEEALVLLSKSSEVGPTAAAPFVERGYILNRLGRFEDARDSYERAIFLVNRYPISRPQESMALRGLGFALIELGDLDGAESAFRRSLEIDADNRLAESELDYIRKLRKKRR